MTAKKTLEAVPVLPGEEPMWALIEVVGNPKKVKERLDELKKAKAELDKAVARFGTARQIEKLLGDAQTDRAQAKQELDDANEKAKVTRQRATDAFAKREKETEAREEAVATREAELSKLVTDFDKQVEAHSRAQAEEEARMNERDAELTRLTQQAREIEATYRARLAQLEGAMADAESIQVEEAPAEAAADA